MVLLEYLEEYKNLTLELIDKVQKDDELSSLLNKRENILKFMDSLNFDKEEIKKIGNSLNLLGLEEELKNITEKEQIKIKQQLEILKRTRKVNKNYNNFGSRAMVFNRTI